MQFIIITIYVFINYLSNLPNSETNREGEWTKKNTNSIYDVNSHTLNA